MYSALPTNLIWRGRASGRKNESRTDTWLGQKMTPPSVGTCSRPSTLMRQRPLKTGLSTARATG